MGEARKVGVRRARVVRRVVSCMFGDGGGMSERWVLGIWMMEGQVVRWIGEVSSRERLQKMSEMTETSGKVRRGSIYESVLPFRREVRNRDST